MVIDGRWFGTKRPKVWLEYQVDNPKTVGEITKTKMLKPLKPNDLDMVDAKGKPSYMNANDGDSAVTVVFTEDMIPLGFTGFLVLDNGIGLATIMFGLDN